MSDTEAEYVKKGDDGTITIYEDGFITPETIDKFKYTFGPTNDITESLSKKSTAQSKNIAKTHTGRTGYAAFTCTYPDGSTSSKVVLTDVVIQYITDMHRDTSTYAKDYIFIGIPEIYISTIGVQAKANSSVNVAPKAKEKLMSGYYWISCNLDNLSASNTSIAVEVADGEYKKVDASIFSILDNIKQHIVADITATVSASMTNTVMAEELDLHNGQYHFTIKPTQLSAKREITVDAPTIVAAEKRAKERSEIGASSIASSKIAEMAMRRLNITK